MGGTDTAMGVANETYVRWGAWGPVRIERNIGKTISREKQHWSKLKHTLKKNTVTALQLKIFNMYMYPLFFETHNCAL